ncbi:transmembrane protein, putative, partial [Rhizoctonia solani AG-3 Rhs1AP]
MVSVKFTTLLITVIFSLGFNVYTAHGLNLFPLLRGLLSRPIAATAVKAVKMTAVRGSKPLVPAVRTLPKPGKHILPTSPRISGGRISGSRMSTQGNQGSNNGNIELAPSRWSKHAEKLKSVTKLDSDSRSPENGDPGSTTLLRGNRKSTKHDSKDRQEEDFMGAEDQRFPSHDSPGALRGGRKGIKHDKSSDHESKGNQDESPTGAKDRKSDHVGVEDIKGGSEELSDLA